jgi:hypothetical protein
MSKFNSKLERLVVDVIAYSLVGLLLIVIVLQIGQFFN